FDSRVVFVDETGSKERRVKRLALMDQDGANVRYLTRGADLVLTPRFSPSSQEITYMEFGQGEPRVYLYNIETGQREIVGNFPGMSFSPRFSPDGQRIIMSLQQGANSNLFVMDLRSKTTTRLTDTPAIDTSPSYAPDGGRLCFESDRGGKPQIYVMAATGGAAQRISFGDGSYSTPAAEADHRCSPSISPVATSNACRHQASLPTRPGRLSCRRHAVAEPVPEAPVERVDMVAPSARLHARCADRKQRPANDVPSERLHLAQVQVHP